MREFYFEKGLVINQLGVELEYVARTTNELYFEEVGTRRRETILEGEFFARMTSGEINIVDAFSSPKLLVTNDSEKPKQVIFLDDVKPEYQRETELRLNYILELQRAGLTIGQRMLITIELPKIAAKLNDMKRRTFSSVYRWWRKFKDNDNDSLALVSKNAVKKSPVRIDAGSEQFIQEKIEQYYLIMTRPSVQTAYYRYVHDLEADNEVRRANQLPALRKIGVRTFSSRINALDEFDKMVAREGRKKAVHHFNMIRGHLPANHPLDSVEIDHSPLDLFVLDDLALLPLGRPWFTVIKDRYSGILLGFYVSFQKTGLGCIFGAIKHSLHSHHLAYQRWPELENPWPAYGRGFQYVSDRGADFQSMRLRSALTSLGATYELCKKETPWLKGSIERFFKTLDQTFFEDTPGRTFRSLDIRGDYDSAKHAVVRFTTLIFLLHKWAADFHNVALNSRKMASPLELWNEGIGVAPPPYPANANALNIILGTRHQGALSHEGIRYKRLNFADDALADLMKSVGRDVKVDYVVSLENLGFIHVRDPRNNEYLKVPCTRMEYADGLSLSQHQYLLRRVKEDMKEGATIKTLLETRATIAEVVAEEIARKETATKSRLARVANMNSESVLLGKTQSVINPFMDSQRARSPQTIDQEIAITDIPRYSWGG